MVSSWSTCSLHIGFPVAAQVCDVTKLSNLPHVSFCSVHPSLVRERDCVRKHWDPTKMNIGHELLKTSINIYRMNNRCWGKGSLFSNLFCNLTHCSLHVKLYSYNPHYNQLNIIFTNPNVNSLFFDTSDYLHGIQCSRSHHFSWWTRDGFWTSLKF